MKLSPLGGTCWKKSFEVKLIVVGCTSEALGFCFWIMQVDCWAFALGACATRRFKLTEF